MNELSAVNQMLLSIGQSPVEDFGSGLYEEELARSMLAEVVSEVLTEGWNFNTDEDVLLGPDMDGLILLPTDALDVYVPRNPLVSHRKGKLYDRKNKTFVFTEGVRVTIRRSLDFDDLPATARTYCYMKAARRFQQKMLGSQALDAFSEQDLGFARHLLQEFDTQDATYNMTRNNPNFQLLYQGRS